MPDIEPRQPEGNYPADTDPGTLNAQGPGAAAIVDPSGEPEPSTGDAPPMLDVHPPHEPIHTWKAYLLHMSTIVLGLLIAIGLEQGVEAIHRARERSDLRESLRSESERALRTAERTEMVENEPLDWLNERTRLVETALATHSPLSQPLPRKPHVSSDLPEDPAWNAAKSSGLLSLLTQHEIEAYSDADLYFAALLKIKTDGADASYKRAGFEIRHRLDDSNSTMLDLSRATPEELNNYIDLLQQEYAIWDQYRVTCQYVRGTESSILAGEFDLEKIQKGSRRFYTAMPPQITQRGIQ